MRLVPEIQTTNLLALTSELFGKSKIINLPEKAEYSFQDAAIDFHDIPYYGDKNNGTSWGYSFCSLDIIGDIKLTLDVIDINGLAKNYAILMESMMQRLNIMGIMNITCLQQISW
jgi:hypothetical protein